MASLRVEVDSRVMLRRRELKVQHEAGGEFPLAIRVDLFIEDCLYGLCLHS